MPKQLFGTDGIRGVPGRFPLDDATLHAVGRSLGAYLRCGNGRPRVIVGMDTRESGPHIGGQIAAGLAEEGTEARSTGVMTTPGLACLVRKGGFSAGVVISASHNPFQDNGVKLFAGSGMKFPDDIEEQIEAAIPRYVRSDPAPAARHLGADLALEEDYLSVLRSCVLPGANLSQLRIVLDCANGAASKLAPALFRSLGTQVIAIHDRPDGRNINAGCGSLHPEDLRARVLAEHAALGVAFDGDADRAIFVSGSGRVVDGDGVLLASARYMRSIGRLKGNRVIGTTMSNLGLERALAGEGLLLTRVPVGDRYVLEEMLRSGANLGGEQSGHIIFLDEATTGDGLLTAIKIASLVALAGPLDSLVQDFHSFPQTILNVDVRSKPPFDSLPAVAQMLRTATDALGASGRIVLRYSGTEPKARVMVEAERGEDVTRWAEAIAAEIESAIGS